MFVLELLDEAGVHLDFLGSNGDTFDQGEVRVTGELTENPEEGLLVLIVGLGGNVVVLERALAVESDLSGLDLSVLGVDLVTDENDGDVLADTGQILVPLGNVLIGDSCGDIEHHDGSVGTDAIFC